MMVEPAAKAATEKTVRANEKRIVVEVECVGWVRVE